MEEVVENTWEGAVINIEDRPGQTETETISAEERESEGGISFIITGLA